MPSLQLCLMSNLVAARCDDLPAASWHWTQHQAVLCAVMLGASPLQRPIAFIVLSFIATFFELIARAWDQQASHPAPTHSRCGQPRAEHRSLLVSRAFTSRGPISPTSALLSPLPHVCAPWGPQAARWASGNFLRNLSASPDNPICAMMACSCLSPPLKLRMVLELMAVRGAGGGHWWWVHRHGGWVQLEQARA